jgi:hypothetical protein
VPTSEERADRERLDRVFGAALPDATGDERGEGSEPDDSEPDRDEELRRNVPPHHG